MTTKFALRSITVPFFALLLAQSLPACAAKVDPPFDSGPAPKKQKQAPGLHGVIRDPLGAVVPFAQINLYTMRGTLAFHTVSGPFGEYYMPVPASARYRLRVDARSFQPIVTPGSFYPAGEETRLDLTLATPTLTQEVTVTANGTPTPEAQVGGSVTVLDTADYKYMPEVQEPLRLIPGVQLIDAGQTGGLTSLSIRGAATDATKVLIDGVPANSVGGSVAFQNLATTGIRSIEVLREPDSAIYGSDALAGVISLTTPRGATRLPLITYSGDGGNFGTYRNEVTASGTFRQFDVYSAFARLDTNNNQERDEFHNATYAGNFGWTPNAANDVRVTFRDVDVSAGQPNATALYGIADNAQQKEQDSYLSALWNTQSTPRWHNELQYGRLRQNGRFTSFAATGIFDPANQVYDGEPVTITGANGYTVSGQAVFQYSNGAPPYLENTNRDFVYAQTDYHVTSHFSALGAFKYESESGYGYSSAGTSNILGRGNYSYTAQIAGDIRHRLFFNLGTGLEDNGLFGFAATPRASLAYYLARPSGNGIFTGTKLHGNFGKGIKEPSVFQQQDSVLSILQQNGLSSIATADHIGPVGAENSRSYDIGMEQHLFGDKARIGVTYFHDQFTNGVEYVYPGGLQQLGVPPTLANNAALTYGAYINSLAVRSQGVELETEFRLTRRLFARAGYTYTDPVVQHSFSSDNLSPSFNTAFNFPTVAIGAYSPLDGQRPFGIAPNTAYFAFNYTRTKFSGSLTGILVGQRDDSTFLTDANFGSSLLLPNRDLDGSYHRLELSGTYKFNKTISTYARIQNLLSEHYFEEFGYPSLPLTFRAGVTLTFGGESWRLR